MNEIALALQRIGLVFSHEKSFGSAAAKFEESAELFREIGDSQHELKVLQQLHSTYGVLKDQNSLSRISGRLTLFQNGGKDSGDSQSGENWISNFFNIFKDSDKGQYSQLQVEACKCYMTSIALNIDSNEKYMQKRLVQVHFENLPFERIEARVRCESLDSIDQVVALVRSAVAKIQPPSNSNNTKLKSSEMGGTLKMLVAQLDSSANGWSDVSTEKVKEIEERVLTPLLKMREAFVTICENALQEKIKLEKQLEEQGQAISNSEVVLEKLKSKIESLQSKSKTSMSKEGFVNDLLNKRPDEALKKAVSEACEISSNIYNMKEITHALRGAHKATCRRACQDLELYEQTRMEVLVSLIMILSEIQLELLDLWCKHVRKTLAKSQVVDCSSDMRTFTNRQLVQSVLLGQQPPSTLLCSPLKYDQETIDCKTTDDDNVPPAYKNDIDVFMDSLASNSACRLDVKTLRSIQESFESTSAREYFLLTLNRFRSQNTKVSKIIMEDLILIMIGFLDSVYVIGDIRASKMALILSETFYCDDMDVDKEESAHSTNRADGDHELIPENRFYVQDGIKDHGIWKSNHFWEETFYIAVREEVNRNVVKSLKDDGKSNRKRSLSVSNYRNIAYGQISSTAFAMRSSGMQQHQIVSFIERACIGNEIEEKDTSMLLMSFSDI